MIFENVGNIRVIHSTVLILRVNYNFLKWFGGKNDRDKEIHSIIKRQS